MDTIKTILVAPIILVMLPMFLVIFVLAGVVSELTDDYHYVKTESKGSKHEDY